MVAVNGSLRRSPKHSELGPRASLAHRASTLSRKELPFKHLCFCRSLVISQWFLKHSDTGDIVSNHITNHVTIHINIYCILTAICPYKPLLTIFNLYINNHFYWSIMVWWRWLGPTMLFERLVMSLSRGRWEAGPEPCPNCGSFGLQRWTKRSDEQIDQFIKHAMINHH